MREKRERRARKEGGEPRAQIPFPLTFRTPRSLSINFVMAHAYIIAVQLSVAHWPGKLEMLEKIFSRLLPTG